MSGLRGLPGDEAVARVVALHVDLARSRDETLAALHVLDSIVVESAHQAPATPEDSMSITELSVALGVRSSALRFWEQQELITPRRTDALRTRRYDPTAIRDARVVVALRAGGYRVPAVRAVMASLRSVADPTDAREALQDRLRSIAARSAALLRAGADLSELLRASHADGSVAGDGEAPSASMPLPLGGDGPGVRPASSADSSSV
jgi:DNA-binding transcriptional MerR regulator